MQVGIVLSATCQSNPDGLMSNLPPKPAMRAPAALAVGAVVRIIACSGPVDPKRFESGLQVLQDMGYQPRYDPGLLTQEHYFAGPESRRREELQHALQETDTQAIWAARGGFGAAYLAPSLNLEAIAAGAKWLIGYSDVGVLHCAWARAGLASMHAANITGLAQWQEGHRDSLFALLRGEQTSQRFEGRWVTGQTSETISGTLLGGNLTVLASLCGTGQLPSWQDAIVFLEDVGETPYRLDRAVTQLRLSGAFEGARGVVIGQLTRCAAAPTSYGASLHAEQALAQALAPTGLPVIAGLPVGHEDDAQALCLGHRATMHVATGRVSVHGV